MTDREIYLHVRADALAGVGGSFALRGIVRVLDGLLEGYGEYFTINGALNQLDQIVYIAYMLKDELQKAKKANHE